MNIIRRVAGCADAASGKFLIMPQPSYGARTPFTVRVPDKHAAVYKREAERLGMKYSDYLAAKLAESHGLDAPESVQARHAQEVLPDTA